MKKHSRITASILAVLLITSSLVGCTSSVKSSSQGESDSGSSVAKTDSSEKEKSAYAPDPNEKYKISWVANFFGPVDEDGFMLKQWEEQFNVDIDFWYIDSTKFDEVFNLKLASNEIPDVIQTRTMNSFNKYNEQKVLAEIPEDMVDTYMPAVKAQIEKEVPGVMKYGLVDGKRYGIPAEMRLHNQFRAPSIFRGDWLETVGITKTPETLAEFEEAFYKFANDDPDGNGKKDTYGLSASGFNAIYGAFGYMPKQWKERDGKLVYTSVQPEIKEALTILNKWYKDGVIDPEFITGENKGGYWALSHAFIESKIGYTGHGAYYHWCNPEIFPAGQDYVEMQKLSPDAVDKLVHSNPPVGADGQCMVRGENIFTGNFLTFGEHMEKELPKMAKVLEIQEYISGNTPERYQEFYYGKEGEMWEYDDEGVPTPMGVFTDPKEMAKVGAHFGLVLFSTMNNHSVINKRSTQWANENKFAEHSVATDLMVGLPSAGTYQVEMDKIEGEAFTEIITGTKPIDYFDEFVTKWTSAGGEVLTKEANDWYATVK